MSSSNFNILQSTKLSFFYTILIYLDNQNPINESDRQPLGSFGGSGIYTWYTNKINNFLDRKIFISYNDKRQVMNR